MAKAEKSKPAQAVRRLAWLRDRDLQRLEQPIDRGRCRRRTGEWSRTRDAQARPRRSIGLSLSNHSRMISSPALDAPSSGLRSGRGLSPGNLHRPRLVIAPAVHHDGGHAAAARGEKRGVPVRVASSIISTTPSILRPAGLSAPMSTSAVSVCRTATCLRWKPKASMWRMSWV